MKLLTLPLLLLPLLAQNNPLVLQRGDPEPEAKSKPIRRLESIVIDAQEWKVRVNVSEGHNDRSGNFVADKLLPEYTIDPDERLMALGDEKRSFNEDAHKAAAEGEALNEVLEKLARYAMDSVRWWEAGEGAPIPQKQKAAVSFGSFAHPGAVAFWAAEPWSTAGRLLAGVR